MWNLRSLLPALVAVISFVACGGPGEEPPQAPQESAVEPSAPVAGEAPAVDETPTIPEESAGFVDMTSLQWSSTHWRVSFSSSASMFSEIGWSIISAVLDNISATRFLHHFHTRTLMVLPGEVNVVVVILV